MHDQFKTAWGAEFRTLRPVASIRLKKKIPGSTSRGCRVQNSGPWDPWLPVVENSQLFAQRAVRPLCSHVAACFQSDAYKCIQLFFFVRMVASIRVGHVIAATMLVVKLPPPPLAISPPFVRPVPPRGGGSHEVTVPPPLGGGGVAPQFCTIVSQCKSASAPCKNSIASGSAPQREADSQPISQLVRQAVSHAVSWASRQADRQTQPNR